MMVNQVKHIASPFSCWANNLTPPLLSERSVNSEPLCQERKRRWGCSRPENWRWACLKKEKIDFIEYNRAYIDYAKQNRKTSTKAEKIFWWIVKDRKFLWYKFRRQKVVWLFILDFYCSKLLLWIELDGWYHRNRAEYDRMRDAEIYKKGILVIRFKNEDVEKNLSWVISELKKIIQERNKQKLKELLL